MSQTFEQIKVGLDEDLDEKLSYLAPSFQDYRVLRKSVDARKIPHWVYAVEVFEKDEVIPEQNFKLDQIEASPSAECPIIIGSGPAGLFAALRFVERGLKCILLERGSVAEKRIGAINRYWRYGELDLNNNVCFGEGGAGLYSDGKLITRIKSPHIPYIMHKLVEFGAPEEIKYLANPHVGSDRIRRVIPKMREYLKNNGCSIHYDTCVSSLLTDDSNQILGVEASNGEKFYSHHVILATGHSAQDVFDFLKKSNVKIEAKSYALGLRVEHPQDIVNKIQFKSHSDHPALGAANYRLAHHDKASGIGVYSFCMCPGGYVLSSGTEANSMICNGMSNYHRNSGFANSAVVVSVDAAKLGTDIYAGMKLREDIERGAFTQVQAAGGTKQIPVQKLTDFLKRKKGETLKSSSPSGVIATELHSLLPHWIYEKLAESLEVFHQQMRGFIHKDAQFHGVETRTSCPVRVTRDPITLESVSHKGLFPCGEGAGYAGGITSAACDGINCAEKILALMDHRHTVTQSL
jgi:uncharacterized FAD-dependent dehydrogenase